MVEENNSLSTYYSQDQLRKYLIQFMAIFSGLQVSVGKNDFKSESNLIRVPVIHGSKDRVVAHIMARNSPNVPIKLPVLSVRFSDMELALDRMSGMRTVDSHVTFPRGGVFPDDLRTVEKLKPIPWRIRGEVNILTSNLFHQYEILEQIALIFDPDLYLYTSDDPDDHTAIHKVMLTAIDNEENYPAGSERRILSVNMSFQIEAWITAPVNVRDNIIRKIKVRIQNLEKASSFDDVREIAASRGSEDDYENIFDIDDLDPPPR